MKVEDLMQKAVFTVDADDTVDRVFFLLHYEKIRHLPVLEEGLVAGIVSDRDLYKALGPKSQGGSVIQTGRSNESVLYVIPRKVRHIMRRGVVTIEPGEDAAKAARMMARKKIGALPVVRGDKLVGIITSTDILTAFADLITGARGGEKVS